MGQVSSGAYAGCAQADFWTAAALRLAITSPAAVSSAPAPSATPARAPVVSKPKRPAGNPGLAKRVRNARKMHKYAWHVHRTWNKQVWDIVNKEIRGPEKQKAVALLRSNVMPPVPPKADPAKGPQDIIRFLGQNSRRAWKTIQGNTSKFVQLRRMVKSPEARQRITQEWHATAARLKAEHPKNAGTLEK